MARPYWSGSIQISLVSFAVKLFVATEAKSEIRFHQVSRSTGERVRHQKVLQSAVDDGGGASEDNGGASGAVAKDDIVKGYEYAKGQYITIEPSEIAELRVPSKHAISVDQFVDETEIDPAFFEKPYFVAPDGEGQVEAFAVVRKAMQQAGKVGLGKIAFAGREHIVAIMANKDDKHPGLMAYTLRYAEELRAQSEYFGNITDVKVEEDQLELAEALIKKRSAPFDPKKFKDGYEIALRELVDAKLHDKPIPKDEEPVRRAKVINLMDALKNSLNAPAADEPEPEKKKPAVKDKDAEAKPGPTLVPAKKVTAKSSAKAAPRRKSA